MAARHHVDARRHHGRGVDQGRDGRRALHRVREPGVERDLGALAGRAQEQAQGRERDRRAAELEHPRRVREQPPVVQAPAQRRERQHAEQEAVIADPVDDERLLPRRRRGGTLVPEADEQVGAQAHTLPAHEHEQEVVRQHQRQHREREQVEIEEEAADRRVVRHVPGRVDVDEEPHAGHDQRHDGRQRIELEGDVGREVPDLEPGVDGVDQDPVVGGECGQLEHGAHREREGEPHARAGEPPDAAAAEPVAEEQVEPHRRERQRRDHPQVDRDRHAPSP